MQFISQIYAARQTETQSAYSHRNTLAITRLEYHLPNLEITGWIRDHTMRHEVRDIDDLMRRTFTFRNLKLKKRYIDTKT